MLENRNVEYFIVGTLSALNEALNKKEIDKLLSARNSSFYYAIILLFITSMSLKY